MTTGRARDAHQRQGEIALDARIVFVERVEASGERLEDLETGRLVTRYQAGDSEAFADIYRRYFDRVYGYLRVVLRNSHRAEDTAQQVFMQALEALPRYERRRPFEAWLFTIVRNSALMVLRKERNTDVVDPASLSEHRERQGADGNGEVELPSWITDQDLLVLLERMPVAQQQVLLLKFMLGLSSSEIAEVLDRSADSVRMQQSRALAFLRQRLTALGRAPSRRQRTGMRRCGRQAPVLRHRRYALFL